MKTSLTKEEQAVVDGLTAVWQSGDRARFHRAAARLVQVTCGINDSSVAHIWALAMTLHHRDRPSYIVEQAERGAPFAIESLRRAWLKSDHQNVLKAVRLAA